MNDPREVQPADEPTPYEPPRAEDVASEESPSATAAGDTVPR